MTQDSVTSITVHALTVAMKVSLPFLLAGLVVGLLVSIFQAATQIQEMTLTFIPKIIVTGVVIAFGGPWMLDQLVSYTRAVFLSIPTVVAGG
jgi:flagellar biosynthetic protein FliQ